MQKKFFILSLATYASLFAQTAQQSTACDTTQLQPYNKSDILRSGNVGYVNFAFSDINGNLREITLPQSKTEGAIENGIDFDGSSIPGYGNIAESDKTLHADLNTVHELPWNNGQQRFARVMCDVYANENEKYPDPRNILKQEVDRARELGYNFYVGPELEYYCVKKNGNSIEPTDDQPYIGAEVNPINFLKKTSELNALAQQGLPIDKLHHEVGPGQHEVVLTYGDPVTIADNIIITKHTLKSIAQANNSCVTFMPKPFYGQNGSGMHIHFSLADAQTGDNLFYDADDEYCLSKTAKHFIAGVLKYVREMDLLLNSTVNSFKRLVPGYEAPIYACWGAKNRSALIRIPRINRENSKAARAELRCPDPACNPYLAFAFILRAGLTGIEQELELAPATETSLYNMNHAAIVQQGIESLPSCLEEALFLFKQSELAQELLGKELFTTLVNLKIKEAHAFKKAVTNWEHERYL